MQKFLNYKSKIVSSKRDSQKIQEDDMFRLVWQYQQLKTIKKQVMHKGKLESCVFDGVASPIGKEQLIERTQDDSLNRSRDCSADQNDQISMEKQQSTMSSLIGSESKDSIESTQPTQLPYIACSCLRHQSKNQPHHINYLNSSKQTNNPIKNLQERVKARRQVLPSKSDLQIFSNNNQHFLTFYEQSQHKQISHLTKNPNHLQAFNTSRQPLQLSQLHLSKSKTRQRSLLLQDHQPFITQDENQKIEMLFREEYKDIFLSSMSNIQFNQFTSSSNSLKQELDGSSELFNNGSPEVSKFQSILDIISQKDSKNRQDTQKQGKQEQLPRRRQKVMILNHKPVNKNAENIKSAKSVKPLQKEKRPASKK